MVRQIGGLTGKGQKLKDERGLLCGDPHCGHLAGLTPPKWWAPKDTKWGLSEREAWTWLIPKIKKQVNELGPYGFVLCNADAIAGMNEKNKGIQLLTTDRNIQIEMAKTALYAIAEAAECDVFLLTKGSFYHVGSSEDWEETLCNQMRAEGKKAFIKTQWFLKLNGKIIDVRHTMPRSAQKKLRATPLLTQGQYNVDWFLDGVQPLADCIVRSHIHTGMSVFDGNRWYCSLPGLITLGERSARKWNGTVDYGFMDLTVKKDGKIIPDIIKAKLTTQVEEVSTIEGLVDTWKKERIAKAV